jgi:hypothetical protein
MEVPLAIVYFRLARHGTAQLSQAAGDGDEERFFSFADHRPVILTSLQTVLCLWGGGGERM